MPKLIYNFILGKQSWDKVRFGGNILDIINKFKIFLQGNTYYLNLNYDNHLEYLAFTIFLILISFSVFKQSKKLFVFFTKNRNRLTISPFFLLALIVFVGFLGSSSVVHISSIRYALVIIISYSVFLAYGVVYLWHLINKKFRWLAWAAMSLVLINNTYAFIYVFNYNDYKNQLAAEKRFFPTGNKSYAIIAKYLKSENIKFGYGNYWHSYTINFFTKEDIILEPTFSNYIPYYLKRVQMAHNVAYVESYTAYEGKAIPQEFIFYNQKYLYKKHNIVRDAIIFILEKKI